MSGFFGNCIWDFVPSRIPLADAVVSTRGNSCVCDGRLDNRQELTAIFGSRLPESAAAIALAVYEKFGETGFSRLIGDFSLAIWDVRRRCLVLASDYAGTRPLYYVADRARALVSSSLRQLTPQLPDFEPDENFVAGFLSCGFAAGFTVYKGVKSVPPGKAVRIWRDRIDVIPFWELPVGEVLTCADEREYRDRLLTLFENAVRVRIPEQGTVMTELSGGLDSSSVTCAAHQVTRARDGRLFTLSYDYPGATDAPFIRSVERSCNATPIHLDLFAHGFVSPTQPGIAHPSWWQPRLEVVRSKMLSTGAQALLTGQAGDLVMANWEDDSEQIADRIHSKQFFGAIPEAIEWSRHLQIPIYSLVGRAVRQAIGSAPCLSNSDFTAALDLSPDLTSLLPSMLSRAQELQTQRLNNAHWRQALPSRRKRLWALQEMIDSRALQCPEPLEGLSVCHPFADRPLVEFMMKVPSGVTCRAGEPRRLMRAAFRNLLPPKVLRRKSKTPYTEPMSRALRPLALKLSADVSKMRLAELGFIDPMSLKPRLERFVQGLACNESQLRHVILLEFWMRNRQYGAMAHPPSLAAGG